MYKKALIFLTLAIIGIKTSAQNINDVSFEGLGLTFYLLSKNSDELEKASNFVTKYHKEKYIDKKTEMLDMYFTEAMKLFGSAIKYSNLDRIEIYSQRAQLRFLANDYYGLIEDAELIKEASGGLNSQAYYKAKLLKGYGLLKLTKISEAKSEFDSIIEFLPKSNADDILGRLNYMAQWGELDNLKGGALYYRAVINLSQGKKEQACKDFSKSTELYPDNSDSALSFIVNNCQ